MAFVVVFHIAHITLCIFHFQRSESHSTSYWSESCDNLNRV